MAPSTIVNEATLLAHRNEDSQNRRVEILDAAAKLFNSQGVSQTSLQELGDRIGVTRNALYYHFEDREDLLFQTYLRSCEILSQCLACAQASASSALDIVKAFVSNVLSPSTAEPASLNEHGLLRATRLAILTARADGVTNGLAKVLRDGAEAGELRKCDYITVARTIISILHAVPLWNPSPTRTVERSRIGTVFCDLLERGWAVDRNRPVHSQIIDLSPLILRVDGFDKGALDERRKETILATASRIFNSRGVGATKLEHIADELGTSKQQLYRYFKSKHELVAACFKRSGSIYAFIIARALASHGTAGDRLISVIRTNAVVQQNSELQPLHYTTAIGSLSVQDQEKARKWRRESSNEYTRLFEEGERQNEIRPLDLKLLAFIVSGATFWLAKGVTDVAEDQKMARAEQVCDLLRLGLTVVDEAAQ